MKKDYSDTYSERFWDICGVLMDGDIEEPEDILPEDDIEEL